MTAALSSGLRDTVRNRVFQAVYQTFRSQAGMVHLRTTYPTPTPPLRPRWQAHMLLVRQQTRTLATGWIPSWAATWLQQPPQNQLPQTVPPTAPPSGGENLEAGQLGVDQLKDMLADSSNYMVHRTDRVAPGTLKEAVEVRKPAPGEYPAEAVYVMRGVTGIANTTYGVVYKADERFIEYRNGEFICLRDLEPEDAIGWYRDEDLQKAKARRT